MVGSWSAKSMAMFLGGGFKSRARLLFFGVFVNLGFTRR